jgi:hypothetical protein
MEHSPFQKLPAELRNEMFELVVVLPHDIQIQTHEQHGYGDCESTDCSHQHCQLHECRRHGKARICQNYGVDRDKRQAVRDALAFTATCKQIRTETRSTFYSWNKFVANLDWYSCDELELRLKSAPEFREAFEVLRTWIKTLAGAAGLNKVDIKFDAGRIFRGDDLVGEFLVSYDQEARQLGEAIRRLSSEAFESTGVKGTLCFDARWQLSSLTGDKAYSAMRTLPPISVCMDLPAHAGPVRESVQKETQELTARNISFPRET